MAFTELVETQRKYFRSGETKPVQFRKQQLLKLKKFIEENREALAEAVWKDLRRRHESTEILEIGMTIGEIDYFLKNIDEWVKPTHVEKTFTTALDKPVIEKDPKGVVLIVSPWNYPVSMILLPMVPAIAAGNTVVIKPSELSENVAATFEKLIPKYFDPKYVAVVNGGIPETTDLLKERFDHILYTGCPPVAKIIMTAAAKHLTPVTLELGGKCPVVVEDDADIDISAKRIAWGKWLNCGQTCLAPDYILVNSTVKPKLVAAICKYVHEFYGEDIKSSKDYARIINQRHFDRITGLLEKTQGATLLGGESDRTDLYIPPTILDVEKSDAFMHDEIFGPVLPIITVKSFSESLEYIADGEKPLAAYIFTRNEAKVKRLLNETSSGGVTVNDVLMHITVDTLPFGGVGVSGMGRYRGKFGFDTFTHEKSVLHRGFFGESLQASRYPPLNQQKLDQMRRLTGKRISLNLINVATLPIVMASFVFGMLFQDWWDLRWSGNSSHSSFNKKMVDLSEKQSTRVFSRSSQRNTAPVPQRELKKRKSVRFEEVPDESVAATSDFVTKANQEWTFVATCFNLPEQSRNNTHEGENELLNLCNYFDGEEDFPKLNGNPGESIPYEIFAQQSSINWQPDLDTSATVSNLRLTSLLRFESRQKNSSHFKRNDTGSKSPFLVDKNNMEDAFQGRLSCSNIQKSNRSCRIATTEKKVDMCSQLSEEDFWSGVEF